MDLDFSQLDAAQQLVALGGKRRFTGNATVFDFGFRKSAPELDEQLRRKGLLIEADAGERVERIFGDKVFLWDNLRLLNNGDLPPFNWQLTGSCVKGGGENAVFIRIGCEVARGRQVGERFALPWTFYAYALSRWMAYRDDSPGEGSSGSAFALALAEGSIVPFDHPDVPKPTVCGPAFAFTRDEELRLSAKRNIPPGVVRDAKAFPVRFVEVRTADAAEDEIRKCRPLTWAGNWGGRNACPTVDGVLLNERRGTWNHQQCCIGMWKHPRLGRIWCILNQWYMPGNDMKVQWINTPDGQAIAKILKPGIAVPVHGMPQNGEPPGIYWIRDEDMAYQCRTGEVRALGEISGFAPDNVNMGTL